MRGLARAVAVLVALGILVIVALPNTGLAWIRHEYRWIGNAVNWVEGLWPAIDTVHILLFSGLAALARLALPGMPWMRLLVWLVLFSAVSELVQFWAPGREPKWSDFAQDLVGVALGLAPFAIWAMVRRMGRRKSDHPGA